MIGVARAARGIRRLTPEEFKGFHQQPFANIATNIHLVERDATHCTVITETRVFAGGRP